VISKDISALVEQATDDRVLYHLRRALSAALQSEEVKPLPTNIELADRNWSIWRDHYVNNVNKADLARQHDITKTRITGLLGKQMRRVMQVIRWDRGHYGRPMREALLGVEVVWRAGEPDYLRMPDGREVLFNGMPYDR
jgi:hypothetical protein